MEDKEVKAYAQSLAAVERAYRRNGDALDANIVNEAARFPARGFMMALREGLAKGYITPDDHRLIAAYLDALDGPSETEDEEPLGDRQGCNWWILYYHWQDIMTAKKAAEELGVTTQRVSALKRSGKLEHVTVSGHDYFTRASVFQRRIADKEAEESDAAPKDGD